MLGHKSLLPLGATLVAVGLVGGLGAQALALRDRAHARTASAEVALRETAQLRISRNAGSLHEAKGAAVGTLTGSVYLRIHVETASQMSAFYEGKSGTSTLTGRGTVSYHVSGSDLTFTGISSIVKGTGKYQHAAGTGIRLEGTMNRVTRHITMIVNGSFSK